MQITFFLMHLLLSVKQNANSLHSTYVGQSGQMQIFLASFLSILINNNLSLHHWMD